MLGFAQLSPTYQLRCSSSSLQAVGLAETIEVRPLLPLRGSLEISSTLAPYFHIPGLLFPDRIIWPPQRN